MCTSAFSHLPSYVGILISLAIVIPLSLIRELHFFHKTSTIGFLTAVIILIIISVFSLEQSEHANAVPFKISGLFKYIGVAMFAYEGICNALPIRYSMAEPKKFPKVFLISSLVCLVMYIVFIIINCVALGNKL